LACEQAGVPAAVIGTTGGPALEIAGLFSVPLDELAEAHRAALGPLFA
jgi:hypothetical protein